MSFASELKLVRTLDDARALFDNEIVRLSTLSVYQSSEKRYHNRINTVKNDIYNHLSKRGVQGVLYLREDLLMRYDDDENEEEVDVKQSADYKWDVRFFRCLYAGIFVWASVFVWFTVFR